MPSVTWQHLLHDTALRMSALVGSLKTDITTTYDTAVLTNANFKSAAWPFNSFRDALVMAVSDFSWAIADTGGHPWRPHVGASITAGLATGVQMPSVAINTKDIIGVFGAVFDSSDNHPLTEQPLDVVRRANQESTWRTYPVYWFKIDGGFIYHTRPFVEVECCTLSQADLLTGFLANTPIPLPDVLRPALMARAVSVLTKDQAFIEQAATFRTYSDEALNRIRSGLITLPNKTLPTPTVTTT